MALITGTTQTYSISCTLNTGEDCSAATYVVTVTGGPTPSLIFLTSVSAHTITFTATSNLASAGTYTVSVKAKAS
jgi:hypothetical protein